VKLTYIIDQERYSIELEITDEGYLAKIGEKEYQIPTTNISGGKIDLQINGKNVEGIWAIDGNRKRWVAVNGREWLLEKATSSKRSGMMGMQNADTSVYAPMPGQVRQVLIEEGEDVSSGQLLLLLEAMKMEIRILSPGDGKIIRLNVKEDQQVDKDDFLLEIE
jgi:biotin carboxyl carrier protein